MSTVIEVANGGVNWAAIAAASATVVAAVGGIWGTAHQARRAREATSKDLEKNLAAATNNLRMSISAEDKRARRVEKRQIYAQCQASFMNMGATVLA